MKALPLMIATAACQSAPVPDESIAACSVTVRFGSYAMGIDTAAAARIEALLAENRDSRKVSREGGGREGEYALCVSAADAAGAARLVTAITALLPERPRGPISVEGAGRKVEAPAP
ncbi:MAG TPA: hypothetical protein VEZ70_06190 [Allosphingosinicella sp.]|nr:hypothetical protein [Allosphingosinicella sp.]